GKTDTLFVMISQVQAKEMVGEAYEAGIEFFIHKPINSVEVVSVLGRVCEFLRLRNTVNNVFRSLSEWGENTSPGKNKTFATDLGQKIRLILFDMGIAGEAGVRDLEEAGIFLVQNQLGEAFSIKELLVHLAGKSSPAQKAAEQRMRRAIQSAFRHLSAIGVEDYSNPRFESYASTNIDFVEIRKEMRRMETGKGDSGKVGLKRFIHALAHRASQE
ncbi:MAG: DNA-binding domain-containing protein, partial [bacterium]|nr:DNA-binding domain-containing protein [bacterium]